MSCTTCGHTMQSVGYRVWWCPRCGSLKTTNPVEAVAVPSLVERCREYGETIKGECALHAYEWNRVGIREAINLPVNRRPPIGDPADASRCPRCEGSGQYSRLGETPRPCAVCGGTGIVTAEDAVARLEGGE